MVNTLVGRLILDRHVYRYKNKLVRTLAVSLVLGFFIPLLVIILIIIYTIHKLSSY